MRRKPFSFAALLPPLLFIAVSVVWVRSYRSVQCLGYAAPARGELDVLMKEGRVAVVWGPPAEAFLATNSIAPATPSEPDVIHLVPLRSGFVRGAGPWIVQRLRTGAGGTMFFGGPRLPPGVMPKVLTAPSAASYGYARTVPRWKTAGILYQVRLIVSDWPGITGTICGRELWFPPWLTGVLAIVLLALASRRLQLYPRNRTRPKLSFCIACSYNLTANTSGVCPECGTAVEATA